MHTWFTLLLVLTAGLGVPSAVRAERDLSLKLNKISQTTSPKAKCIDGTAPAYYWRDGVGNGSKSAILFLEGGGHVRRIRRREFAVLTKSAWVWLARWLVLSVR